MNLKGLKVIIVLMSLGFILSFWWLAPMVTGSFLAGMYFMWMNKTFVERFLELWRE